MGASLQCGKWLAHGGQLLLHLRLIEMQVVMFSRENSSAEISSSLYIVSMTCRIPPIVAEQRENTHLRRLGHPRFGQLLKDHATAREERVNA